MANSNYIFVCQTDDGEIFAGTKTEIDSAINTAEATGDEITWKSIARIKTPPDLDFSADQIEWFEKNPEREKSLIDKAVLAIIQVIR